jgi:hypothetical protein
MSIRPSGPQQEELILAFSWALAVVLPDTGVGLIIIAPLAVKACAYGIRLIGVSALALGIYGGESCYTDECHSSNGYHYRDSRPGTL